MPNHDRNISCSMTLVEGVLLDCSSISEGVQMQLVAAGNLWCSLVSHRFMLEQLCLAYRVQAPYLTQCCAFDATSRSMWKIDDENDVLRCSGGYFVKKMSLYFKHVPHIEDILLVDGNDCNGNCLAIEATWGFSEDVRLSPSNLLRQTQVFAIDAPCVSAWRPPN